MFDLAGFIRTAGYLGIFGVIFAESGLLIGFFLPGDSFLFTAGFLASQDLLDIRLLAVITFVAAVIGDSVGYSIGRKVGPKIFTRGQSAFFSRQNAERAREFYERHGGKAITLARFVPVVRTFAPIIAGVAKMPYGSFLFYNVAGGAIWGAGIPLLGYFLGSAIPNVDRYLLPIIIGIIVVSFIPGIVPVIRDPETRKSIIASLKRFWKKWA